MSQNEQNNHAKIYDQGYRPFQGQLALPGTRFWPIASNELRQAWKEKWFRRLLWGAFIPLVVFCVLVVISARFPTVDLEIGSLWLEFWSLQTVIAGFMIFFIGRGAIGEDLRTGALSAYFSRPVSFVQYLVGKWLAISVGVLGVTILPGLVLATFKWLAEPDSGIVQFLSWMGKLALLTGLACGAFGMVMLAISSLTRRSRMAGIVWLAMFFMSSGLAEGLTDATGLTQFVILSPFESNVRMANFLFESQGSLSDAFWYVLSHLVWTAMAFGVVLIRLRRWVRM